jgi:predicted membrane-bound spermidine synthase
MVELNYKIFIVGMICLAVMYMFALVYHVDGEAVLSILSGLIGMLAGIMIPAPKQVKGKRGVLKW